MSVTFTDNSKDWNDAIFAACNEGLTVAAAFTADAFRNNIGTEGGRAIAISNTVSGSKRRTYRQLLTGESVGGREGRRLWEASPPGKFPGSRTGALRRSMSSTKAENLSVLVGSSLKYALWLETGWQRKTPLTAKQLRFLHAMMRDLKNSGIQIKAKGAGGATVPARPWLRRTVRENATRIGEHFSRVASESIARRVT